VFDTKDGRVTVLELQKKIFENSKDIFDHSLSTRQTENGTRKILFSSILTSYTIAKLKCLLHNSHKM